MIIATAIRCRPLLIVAVLTVAIVLALATPSVPYFVATADCYQYLSP